VKEMTMNKLDFGEIVFGGNMKMNLKTEANISVNVNKEKRKQDSKAATSRFFGLSRPSLRT